MSAAVRDQKQALRRKVLARRAALGPETRRDASLAIATHVLANSVVGADSVVGAYWPIRDEVDCRPIVQNLHANNRALALPVVQGREAPLLWRLWDRNTSLVPGGFGALVPPEEAPGVSPTILLMPLLGFDAQGTRLGYGGGYYDRSIAALSHRPLLVGLAFAVQELPEIPREVHDMALDAVVTETGLRYFGRP